MLWSGSVQRGVYVYVTGVATELKAAVYLSKVKQLRLRSRMDGRRKMQCDVNQKYMDT